MRPPTLALAARLLMLAGCGRFGFDETEPGSLPGFEAAPDAIGAAAPAPSASRGAPDAGDPGVDSGDVDDGSDGAIPLSACAEGALPLLQWFAFDGTGVDVVDRSGGAQGTAIDAALDGTGGLALDGSGGHVDLPSRELRADTSSTALYWLVWQGGDEQSVFHVQKPVLSLNVSGLPASVALFVSEAKLTLRYEVLEGSQEITSTRSLVPGKLSHLAIVFDAVKRETTLYLDGENVASAALEASSTDVIYGERLWLGRTDDLLAPTLAGRFEDLRVIPQALTACQVRAAHAAGPQAAELCSVCD